MSFNPQGINRLSRRLKLVLGLAFISLISTIVALIVLEGLNFFNAIYFLVITFSTVGYGDITPSNPITRLLIIILLLTSLTTVASFSEIIADRFIVRRYQQRLILPETGLETSPKVVVAYSTDIGRQIAKLAQQRFLPVLMLDKDLEKVQQLRDDGFQAYAADVTHPSDLEHLNLEATEVFYLFLPSNDEILKASIILRSLNNNMHIYPLTVERNIKQEYGNLLGITRIYSYERLLGSFISVLTRVAERAIVANQPERRSQYYFSMLRLPLSISLDELFTEYYILGVINRELNQVTPITSPNYKSTFDKGLEQDDGTYALVILYPKSIDDQIDHSLFTEMTQQDLSLESRFHHIIICGFSQSVYQVLQNLRVPSDRFVVFTFDEEEAELAKMEGFESYCILERNKLPEFLEEHVDEGDVVFNFFESLEDALITTASVLEYNPEITIYQISSDPYETRVLSSLGVTGVINPDLLVIRAMFWIYLRSWNYSMSNLYGNYHAFEHLVEAGDSWVGRSLYYVQHHQYKISYYRKASESKLSFVPDYTVQQLKQSRISEGDILFVETGND